MTDRKLQEHMARLGAGLQMLKMGRAHDGNGAPITDVVSYLDRVVFNFEGEPYEISRSTPSDAAVRADNELGVTPEVAVKLLNIREALAHDNIHEAWHWLYKVADSEVESFTPWVKLEACAALAARTGEGK